MRQIHALSHADAMTIIDSVRRELERDNLGAAVAVCDAHGELLAFLRTDGCPLQSGIIAQNKAFTAARERRESRAVGEQSRADNFPLTNFGDSRFVGWGGGVPIFYQGECVGAVGISGLPESVDIEMARRAASLIGA